MRRRERIALGDGENARLERAIRVHANFAEYVPLALLLAAFVELQRSSPLLIHLIGLALITGRVIHAYGVSKEKEDYRFRVVGMGLTFGAIFTSALRLFELVFIWTVIARLSCLQCHESRSKQLTSNSPSGR